MTVLKGFIGQSYTGRSRAIDSQICMNLYPEIEDQSSKNVMALLGTPGLTLIESQTVGAGLSGRGIYKSPATLKLYFVIGNSVFLKDTDDTTSLLGEINTSSGTVKFAENAANQVMMVDGTDGWIINTSTDTLTQISDSSYPTGTSHVVFISGYFLVNKGSTGEFYWSAIDNGFSWNALHYANAEGSPDSLEGLVVNRNELWLIGKMSSEVWSITQETDVSKRFLRIPGTLHSKGTSAKYSIQQIHDHNFYLGSDIEGYGIVWMTTGYEHERVSTTAIEYQIRSYDDISDAIGFIYQFEGHVFYVLTFPSANVTWVYDLYTGMWHQWSYYNPVSGQDERTKCIYQAFANGKNYVLDRDNPNLYTLDLDVYTDNGDAIRRIRSSPHIHNDRKRIFYKSFEVDIESGVGLTTGQGSNPKMALQISNDGGYSFGNELWASMGKKGERRTRVQWHRLGRSRDRVFKIIISDPVKVVIINAYVEVESER